MPHTTNFRHILPFVEKNVATYTSFPQSALVYLLDPEWGGSCGAIAYDFMVRKVEQGVENGSILTPILPEITDPRYPHPLIVGVNSPEAKKNAFRLIGEHFNRRYRPDFPETSKPECVNERNNTDGTREQKANRLVDIIVGKNHSCGIVSPLISIILGDGSIKKMAHATAFVKRGEEVSFADPNQGEVNFNKAKDFRKWMVEEIVDGDLHYLIHDERLSRISPSGLGPESKKEEYPADADDIVKRFVDSRNKLKEGVANLRGFLYGGSEITFFSADKLTLLTPPPSIKVIYGPDGKSGRIFILNEEQRKKEVDTEGKRVPLSKEEIEEGYQEGSTKCVRLHLPKTQTPFSRTR